MWPKQPLPPTPPAPSGTLIDMSFSVQLQWALFFAVFWAFVIELSTPTVVRWVSRQPWWPAAMPVQKKLMVNFGYPDGTNAIFPEGLTPAILADGYGVVWIYVGTHAVCTMAMLPVVFLGWEESGPAGRTAFVLAALGDVGFDVYDWIKLTWKTWLPSHFVRITGQTPGSLPFWIIICLLHHPLAMTLVIPMNLYYSWLPAYHKIAFALLAAASICFGLGQYKMSLDVSKRTGFTIFKLIVFSAFVTIVYTRVYVWAVEVRSALATFDSLSDVAFYRGGLGAAMLMSIFNLALVNDAATALFKYMLKPLPTTPAAREQIQEEQATTPALGRTMTRKLFRFSNLSPTQKWKAVGNTVTAGSHLAKKVSGEKVA